MSEYIVIMQTACVSPLSKLRHRSFSKSQHRHTQTQREQSLRMRLITQRHNTLYDATARYSEQGQNFQALCHQTRYCCCRCCITAEFSSREIFRCPNKHTLYTYIIQLYTRPLKLSQATKGSRCVFSGFSCR